MEVVPFMRYFMGREIDADSAKLLADGKILAGEIFGTSGFSSELDRLRFYNPDPLKSCESFSQK